jgi:ribonuclease Z
MTISTQILGVPGDDNVLYSEIITGDNIFRILFDCGAGCLQYLKPSLLQQVDHLFVSHFHMDHIAGFDTFFRNNYNRNDKVVNLWGPRDAIKVYYHRLQGFTWNLVRDNAKGILVLHEVNGEKIRRIKCYTRDAFKKKNKLVPLAFSGKLVDHEFYEVHGHILDHGIPCLAYAIQEKEGWILEKDRLRNFPFPSGRWCALVKDPKISDAHKINFGEQSFRVGQLREQFLRIKKGQKIAYLTDFWVTPQNQGPLANFIAGSDVLVAECSYRQADLDLARKNYHVTSEAIGTLARLGGVKKLILIHLSPRYSQEERRCLLQEVRAIFPETFFPDHWE